MKLKKIILILVSLILLAGIGFYFYGLPPIKYWTKNPTNFEECKEATRGFIIKTLPAQCEFRGQNFVDQSQGQTGILNSPSGQTKTPTANALPKFVFQQNGGGCGNIFVHKINSDDTVGISVSAQKDKLGLSTQEKTFEVGKTEGLNIEILTGQHIERLYCNDVVYPDQPKSKKLIAQSGRAIIKISNIDKSLPEWSGNYKATVILKDIHFFDENGNDVGIVDDLMFKDITVGWLAG